MAHKAEISWTRVDESGQKLRVFARHVGNQWIFFVRQRRYEQWQEAEHPSLEDWLELLDAIRRRVRRRKARPDEIQRLERSIRDRFPEAKI
jgi:hypothetical protein